MRIYVCALLAAFLGGFSLALLASYPVPENTAFVCFLAIYFSLTACVFAGWAIVDWAVLRERVKLDDVVKVVVDKLLAERGLRSVDD